MLSPRHRSVALVTALLISRSSAYVTPSLKSKIATKTELFSATTKPKKGISYGEESRKYRRTVYTHDDWVKHRSADRFVRNALSIANSGIYKNIGNEVFFVTGISLFLILWNGLTGQYADLSGTMHDGALKDTFWPVLTLPLTPFTLSSGSLGLLLGKDNCYHFYT